MRTSWSEYDKDLLSYLDLSLEDSQFLEILFEEVQTTSTNCHDRPLYFFSRLSVIATYYQARQANDMPKMKQSLLAIHSMNILQEEANKVFTNEALEIALYLQLKFKEQLSLPIAITSMAHEECAKKLLENQNIDDFVKRCKEAQNTEEKQIEIICQSQYLAKDNTKLNNEVLEKYNDAHEILQGNTSIEDSEYENGKTIAKNAIEEFFDIKITEPENLSQYIKDLNEQQKNAMSKFIKLKMQKEIQESLREKAKSIATSGNV